MFLAFLPSKTRKFGLRTQFGELRNIPILVCFGAINTYQVPGIYFRFVVTLRNCMDLSTHGAYFIVQQ